VILLVFLLRSFLFEPFRIPSGSMMPTPEIGDLILVNKYEYGIRLPVVNKKIIELGQPKRGDVMVFRFPLNPTQDYIKRVVGLPGDRVEYVNKRLTINGTQVPLRKVDPYYDADRMQYYTAVRRDAGRGRPPGRRRRVRFRPDWAAGFRTHIPAPANTAEAGWCARSLPGTIS
jgi:signal peptidase I